MIPVICSETHDGRFVVQVPNGWGGLYPLTSSRDDCRNTAEVFETIHEWWVQQYPEPISIEFRTANDPANDFTRKP